MMRTSRLNTTNTHSNWKMEVWSRRTVCFSMMIGFWSFQKMSICSNKHKLLICRWRRRAILESLQKFAIGIWASSNSRISKAFSVIKSKRMVTSLSTQSPSNPLSLPRRRRCLWLLNRSSISLYWRKNASVSMRMEAMAAAKPVTRKSSSSRLILAERMIREEGGRMPTISSGKLIMTILKGVFTWSTCLITMIWSPTSTSGQLVLDSLSNSSDLLR